MREPSGDHAGESSGSFEPTIACGLPPSASATMSSKRLALLRDVRDARGEHAGIAGELLVDDVGDLVPGGAELRRCDDVRHRGELHLLHGVEQCEAHVHATVGRRTHRPDHHGVGAARAKIAEPDILGARGPRHDSGIAHLPEEAAPLQVGRDDARYAERPGGLVLERDDRNGNCGAAATDDFDGELGARGGDGQHHERKGGENQAGQFVPWPGQAMRTRSRGRAVSCRLFETLRRFTGARSLPIITDGTRIPG
jgi:hypothetical protein